MHRAVNTRRIEEQRMSTLTLFIGSSVVALGRPRFFPGVVGFYFVFRVCLTFLFFQADPVMGTIVNIAIDLALLYGAVLYSAEDKTNIRHSLLQTPPIRWIVALLAFSLISLQWTGAQSPVAALAYWMGMAADVVIVLQLLRHSEAVHCTRGIMKGMVWGAVALSLIAWCTPATPDLRLGNDAFLHPNTLGLEIGTATLIAQYLAHRGTRWKWLGIALAITLLRTLSKTAIIAFVIAECWYLMQNKQMTRKTKMRIGAAALFVVACFWGLLSSYIDVYNNTGSGNQAETLTGRTVLWTVAFSMGMEKPWFGHGLYSFKALIPAFGTFEPVHAHNELLQQFFEFGVAGVAIAAGVYWSFYRQASSAPASELRALALTLLLFTLLHGLTDTVPFGLSYPLWLLTALSRCFAHPAAVEARSV
jgi:O-antigen ligase